MKFAKHLKVGDVVCFEKSSGFFRVISVEPSEFLSGVLVAEMKGVGRHGLKTKTAFQAGENLWVTYDENEEPVCFPVKMHD